MTRMETAMRASEIEQGTTYLSVHNVPYRVIAVLQDRVRAKCESGKSKEFEMPLDKFANAMRQVH